MEKTRNFSEINMIEKAPIWRPFYLIYRQPRDYILAID
jgi:hypothetical protein